MRLFPAVLVATLLGGSQFEPPDGPSGPPELWPPQPRAEATSLLGKALFTPPVTDAARARMETELADARAALKRNANDPDSLIWVGRRTAYLGRFREAIDIFTDGIARYPKDARMYRHRGHRLITVREIDRAMSDLERAADLMRGQPDQVEPDGQPNARNTPTSTLRSNILYHLALARYLKGDFAGAADAWRGAREAVDNPDNLVGASNWLYLSLRRAKRDREAAAVLAPIRADLDVVSNGSYHALLLVYKGERTPDAALAAAGEGATGSAVRYGLSAWHLINGRTDAARKLWQTLADAPDWPSFGVVAAEAELVRVRAVLTFPLASERWNWAGLVLRGSENGSSRF